MTFLGTSSIEGFDEYTINIELTWFSKFSSDNDWNILFQEILELKNKEISLLVLEIYRVENIFQRSIFKKKCIVMIYGYGTSWIETKLEKYPLICYLQFIQFNLIAAQASIFFGPILFTGF